jgi:hypothetical protein
VTTIYVTPAGGRLWVDGAERDTVTLDAALVAPSPGTKLKLMAGRYPVPHPYSISVQGSATESLVLRGEAGVEFDAEREPDPSVSENGPGPDSFSVFNIVGSRGVRIENLTVRNAWPPTVMIDDSTDIGLSDVNIEGGTFATYARGEHTRSIRVSSCRWLQHASIWRDVPWEAMHDGKGVDDAPGAAPHQSAQTCTQSKGGRSLGGNWSCAGTGATVVRIQQQLVHPFKLHKKCLHPTVEASKQRHRDVYV